MVDKKHVKMGKFQEYGLEFQAMRRRAQKTFLCQGIGLGVIGSTLIGLVCFFYIPYSKSADFTPKALFSDSDNSCEIVLDYLEENFYNPTVICNFDGYINLTIQDEVIKNVDRKVKNGAPAFIDIPVTKKANYVITISKTEVQALTNITVSVL